MKKENVKRSSLFLIELMVSILFFALASAVCIQVFAKSHTKSIETAKLNMAVANAQSAAEIFLNNDSPEDMLLLVFPEGQMSADAFTAYFDKDFNSCHKKDASYMLNVRINSKASDQISQITVSESGSEKIIYSLELKKHVPYTLGTSSGQTD